MFDYYGFYTGKLFDAHLYLGAHPGPDAGVTFRTFAPAARKISLIGEFSDWQELAMHKIHDGNFWELHVKNAKPGQMYKYRIFKQDNAFTDHCDPYGFGMELRPGTASIIRDLSEFSFTDEKWMQKRSDCHDRPLNIYELHFGSFRKPSDREDNWYSYTDMIDILLPYVKECGYNYIEILPLSEHPCDESWGYQNTGFFSPTARYGTACQLMKFINACHENNIGVIFDFVPVHFAVDGYGLANYDGTSLYEYPHQDVGVSEWGSCNFMHSRGETRSFLQSAANYWLTFYHVDGIRMDAISRIIYWQGDPARGVNNHAVDFIRCMNRGLKALHPTALLTAEDSTSYPGITKSVEDGGLGFDYKWDMGFMNDTLNYFRTAAEYRSENYHKLTFSMMYYYNDRFLLPFSHDENVHGKATVLQKMNGDYEEKFPQARALYMYMYAHPGKKLNFMGSEIGQLREWSEKREQDWSLLKYPIHDGLHHFIKKLNAIYLTHPAFSRLDFDREGFQWLDCHQEKRCIYAFERSDGKERIAIILNLSRSTQKNYKLSVPGCSCLQLLLTSDEAVYGGSRNYTLAEDQNLRARNQTVTLTLPPYSAFYYLIK